MHDPYSRFDQREQQRDAKPISTQSRHAGSGIAICGRGCAWTANRRLRRGGSLRSCKRRATSLKVAA